ncbi:MAG: DUF3791 domain-containing protein [Candidatus Ancillula sp.]|jgi:hypothetical protein|nr:DUF3791 domain-containing protein [Candidatus Ancillula sp.]
MATEENYWFLIYIAEKVARRFFNGDKSKAYFELKKSGSWDRIATNYDAVHSADLDYILDDIAQDFRNSKIKIGA